MDEFMKWATGICVSSAVVCIVEMFISDMVLEKTVRYVLGVFMLCSVIVPLGNVIGDFSADIGNVGEFSGDIPEEISQQRIEYLQSEIKRLIENKLAEENIFPVETSVCMDIDESNRISMIRADIILERKDIYRVKRVKEVTGELGIESNVRVIGGKYEGYS